MFQEFVFAFVIFVDFVPGLIVVDDSGIAILFAGRSCVC
jgi:hypothetical protein